MIRGLGIKNNKEERKMDWKYPIDRRDFLKLAGAAGLTLFGAPIWGERNFCSVFERQPLPGARVR